MAPAPHQIRLARAKKFAKWAFDLASILSGSSLSLSLALSHTHTHTRPHTNARSQAQAREQTNSGRRRLVVLQLSGQWLDLQGGLAAAAAAAAMLTDIHFPLAASARLNKLARRAVACMHLYDEEDDDDDDAA